jgi:hypothetical protein
LRHRNLSSRYAAELEEILRLEVGGLAAADDDEAHRLEPGRRDDVERRSVLAGKAVRLGGTGNEAGRVAEQLAGGGAHLEAVIAEHNENALARRLETIEGNLQFQCHNNIPHDFSKLASRPAPTSKEPEWLGSDHRRVMPLRPAVWARSRDRTNRRRAGRKGS